MKQVKILKNNEVKFGPVQGTEQEIAEYLEKHISTGTFGQAAYSYESELTPAVYEDGEEILDEEGNSFDPPQYERVLVSPATFETINVSADYEIVEEDVTDESDKKLLVEEMRAKGRAAAEACNAVLELIGGFNIDRELTFEQKNEMKILFANTNDALKERQPGYAKYFINSITPDGVLLTQEMKDLCIKLLSDY